MTHISKLSAGNLCTFISDKYNVKLKPTHAHELVAAFFGYKSNAALVTDQIAPVGNLSQAEFIVMQPEDFIDQRRKELSELPLELPDSYTLGESVYSTLFSDKWWKSLYPPFRSFEKLATVIVENNDSFKHAFKSYNNVPMHHIVDVKTVDNDKLLTILHCHETSTDELISDGKTTIQLSRVAGYIGYGKAHVSFERLTGQARQILRRNPEKLL